MSASFKVGLIAILTVATTLFGLLYVWQIKPYSNYQLISYFPHVGGIKVGSEVSLMGVKIGEVMSVVPEPMQRRVKLILNIQRQHLLPIGSHFTIITTGLVGDKNVEVLPPEEETTLFLEPGSEVVGSPPASLDAIFTEAQQMLASARSLVEDEDLRSDIKHTVHMVAQASSQMEGLFKDAKGVTEGFSKLTFQTELLLKQLNQATAMTVPEVENIVRSVRRIAGNIEHLTVRINAIAYDPEILDQTKASIRNMNHLTERWNVLTDDLSALSGQTGNVLENTDAVLKDIREITSDREIKSNLKTVARNATRLTNAVLNLADPEIQRDNQLKLDLRTEALGVANLNQDFDLTSGAQVNFNIFGDLGLDFPISYFRIGLDEIGDTNLINLQAGADIAQGAGVLRFGLVRGRIGAGTDLKMQFLDQPLTLSGELYDINSPRMRLGILQNIYEDYGLSFYWDNQFVTGINQFSLGFRWQPGSHTKLSPQPLPASEQTP